MLNINLNPKLKKSLKIIFWLITLACYVLAGWEIYKFALADSMEACQMNDNVAVIPLHGTIVPYADSSYQETTTVSSDIIKLLEEADSKDKIKYIVLDINSPGGTITAAEEIIAAIKHLKKPIVSLVRDQGDSAAFWIAANTNQIIAYSTSEVGSIAVTSSYTDNALKNRKDGVTFNELNTGQFKDTGNPDKPLTAAERAEVMAELEHLHNLLVAQVAEARNLDVDKIKAIADGRVFTASQALELNLIDRIGTKYDLLDMIAEKIGQKPRICEIKSFSNQAVQLP